MTSAEAMSCGDEIPNRFSKTIAFGQEGANKTISPHGNFATFHLILFKFNGAFHRFSLRCHAFCHPRVGVFWAVRGFGLSPHNIAEVEILCTAITISSSDTLLLSSDLLDNIKNIPLFVGLRSFLPCSPDLICGYWSSPPSAGILGWRPIWIQSDSQWDIAGEADVCGTAYFSNWRETPLLFGLRARWRSFRFGMKEPFSMLVLYWLIVTLCRNDSTSLTDKEAKLLTFSTKTMRFSSSMLRP